MALTFIHTNEVPREHTPEGDVAEIINQKLCNARNVLGKLRWLKPGETFSAPAGPGHQLIYLMEGQATVTLNGKDYEIAKGAGAYLGPNETAAITPRGGDAIKLFQLAVPQIPK
jgi:quercetin dioxygenase-like cupin family protein